MRTLLITSHVMILTFITILKYDVNSGESGSGKTESSKKIMQYIASVSGKSKEVVRVKNCLLSSNPGVCLCVCVTYFYGVCVGVSVFGLLTVLVVYYFFKLQFSLLHTHTRTYIHTYTYTKTTVLEAFGNAKTVVNNNSSRFVSVFHMLY